MSVLQCCLSIAVLAGWASFAGAEEPQLIREIERETLWRNRDGQRTTWFHPRPCVVPSDDGSSTVLMTMQEIGGSDYFGQVHWTETRDGGQSWTEPQPIASLGRDPVPGRSDGLMAGVCDVVPQYHAATKSVVALGHVVFYKGPRFSRGEQLARYPVYVTRDMNGSWSERKKLVWDDPRGSFIYSNNCGQRVVRDDGRVQLAFTFGPKAEHRMVAGVLAGFDGHTLSVESVGPALLHPVKRGLLEPSVTLFNEKIWMTIRAENGHGYVAVSDDGLDFGEKQPWMWDDGSPVTMSTTQQHWLTHSDGLFLVYTRKDESNANVIRWRSPLWVARVDPATRRLVRSSERVVLPLVGDGVNKPDEVALMGNFHVTNVNPRESWVTVGEWMPRRDARGDVLLARIRWAKPNELIRN